MYDNHTSQSMDNPFFFEKSLLHELGHARYLIDLLRLGYAQHLHIRIRSDIRRLHLRGWQFIHAFHRLG